MEALYHCALTGFAQQNAAAKFQIYYNRLFTAEFDFKPIPAQAAQQLECVPGLPGAWQVMVQASELQALSRLGAAPP